MADTIREIEHLEDRLNRQIAKARTQTTVTVVVGVIIVLILFGYYAFLSGQLQRLIAPDELAGWGSTEIKARIPEMRETLVSEVKKSGPVMIDNAVDTMVETQLPEMRTKAESVIKEEVEKELNKYEDQVKDAIDQAFDKHSENISQMIAQLQTEEGTDAFEESLYNTINESMQDQAIQVELETYGVALKEIDAMLISLANDGEETFESDQQRQLVRLLGILRELANRNEIGKVNLEEKQ